MCAVQKSNTSVLVVGSVPTVEASVIASLVRTSVGQRTAGVLTVFVNLVGPVHLTVRLVLRRFSYCGFVDLFLTLISA